MSKLVQIQVKNFRTIATTEELALQPVNVFIGGNNSGKTSVFRALLLAKFGVSTLLRRMVAPRDSLVGVSPVDPRLLTKGTMYVTQGNLSEFHDLPVGEAEELFHLRQRTNPVEVSLKWENGWGITLRFTQPSGTMVKIEPARIVKNTHCYFDGDFQVIGNAARSVNLEQTLDDPEMRKEFLRTLMEFASSGPILVPCTVGMPPHEEIVNYGRVSQLISTGRMNLAVRNVIRFIPISELLEFQEVIKRLFGIAIDKPQLDEEKDVSIALPYKESRTGFPVFAAEAADLGSGAQQIVYLLAFIFRNLQCTEFLMDEPDAHLHPSFIRRLVEALVAEVVSRDKQVFIATHSDILTREMRSQLPSQTALFACNGHGGVSSITGFEDLVSHLTHMGYDERLQQTLEVLRRSRRVVVTEGPSDGERLTSLLRKANPELADRVEAGVAFIPMRGTGQSRLALIGGIGTLASLVGASS